MSGLTLGMTRDAELIASIHAETVSFAYQRFFPKEAPAPGLDELVDLWADRLTDPSATVLVCRDNGHAVGSIMVRRDPDFAGEGQIVGLHVLPAHWGRGVGTALHDAGLGALATGGFTTGGLWVIAQNERARAMYASHGWSLVPDVELAFGGVREVRYRRHLIGSAP